MNTFLKKAQFQFYKLDNGKYVAENEYPVHFNPSSISVSTSNGNELKNRNKGGTGTQGGQGQSIPSGNNTDDNIGTDQNNEYVVSVVRMNMELYFDVSRIYDIYYEQNSITGAIPSAVRIAESAIGVGFKNIADNVISGTKLGESTGFDEEDPNDLYATIKRYDQKIKTLDDVSILNKDLVPAYNSLKKAAYNPNNYAVEFLWGKNLKFKGRISHFDINYTYFSQFGEPLRVKVNLSIEKIKSKAIQRDSNPTSENPFRPSSVG